MALGTLGNIGMPALAEELCPAVIQKAFTDDKTTPVYVKKKATLCLLSFMRRRKQIYNE